MLVALFFVFFVLSMVSTRINLSISDRKDTDLCKRSSPASSLINEVLDQYHDLEMASSCGNEKEAKFIADSLRSKLDQIAQVHPTVPLVCARFLCVHSSGADFQLCLNVGRPRT